MDEGGEFIEEFGKLFLFEEWSTPYCIFWIFVSFLKVASSFYYLGICANIQIDWLALKSTKIIMIIFEIFFLIDMIVNFCRKVTPDGKSTPLDTIQRVAMNYLQTKFIFHLVPLIPIQYFWFGSYSKEFQYWLLIKVYRLKEGLDCFDVPKIMNMVKVMKMKRL